jgi:hypothetical protein
VRAPGGGEIFISRDRCIACGGGELSEVAGGAFGDEPLRSFIESDPWGENPMPILADQRWSLAEGAASASTASSSRRHGMKSAFRAG